MDGLTEGLIDGVFGVSGLIRLMDGWTGNLTDGWVGWLVRLID